ncbi:MAG: tartrate dehydrogenase [Actinobacteria bacterium]|nr:tartrate dehydrogenase [Actinomycetota bacterium]
MQHHAIAVIPGDGIGIDVIREGRQTLEVLATLTRAFAWDFQEFPWSCRYYLQHGAMMPENAIETLRPFDAIYLGAVGFPPVPDHLSLWGLLLPIRKAFQQYVNLRPVRLLPGVPSPLAGKGPEHIDFVCVRENTEGEYAGVGGRVHRGTDYEVAVQTGVFTRKGVERVIRYTFELTRRLKRRHVTNITKSNALQYAPVFWDEVFAEVAKDYPDITTDKNHVDAAAARMVRNPETFDVLVASNLFGDILTDIGGALQGSLGVPPSANINPDGGAPSMFEPVHGSAPDIAGKGIANPVAAVWAAAMMVEELGHPQEAKLLMDAVGDVTGGGILTPDLKGTATTADVGAAIRAALRRRAT